MTTTEVLVVERDFPYQLAFFFALKHKLFCFPVYLRKLSL